MHASIACVYVQVDVMQLVDYPRFTTMAGVSLSTRISSVVCHYLPYVYLHPLCIIKRFLCSTLVFLNEYSKCYVLYKFTVESISTANNLTSE